MSSIAIVNVSTCFHSLWWMSTDVLINFSECMLTLSFTLVNAYLHFRQLLQMLTNIFVHLSSRSTYKNTALARMVDSLDFSLRIERLRSKLLWPCYFASPPFFSDAHSHSLSSCLLHHFPLYVKRTRLDASSASALGRYSGVLVRSWCAIRAHICRSGALWEVAMVADGAGTAGRILQIPYPRRTLHAFRRA